MLGKNGAISKDNNVVESIRRRMMAGESAGRRPIMRLETGIVVAVIAAIVLIVVAHQERMHRDAMDRPQKRQFRSMKTGIELFKDEFYRYPPSGKNDSLGKPYCGAMKLAEAMMGHDRVGFHIDSVFRADGMDSNGVAELYDPNGDLTLRRRGPYLPSDCIDSATLVEIYGAGNTGAFRPDLRVLCDVFSRKQSELEVGMPILYYKADTLKTAHDIDNPDNPNNIYNYQDNHSLLGLGVPGKSDKKHPLYLDPRLFYRMMKSKKTDTIESPFQSDAYILISAGRDGLYGTGDDICNFKSNFPKE